MVVGESVVDPTELKRWILFSTCLLLASLQCKLSEPLGGSNFIHVATDGSDSKGNGSENRPFGSIQYAIDRASAGSTILIHEGVYFPKTTIACVEKDDVSIQAFESKGEIDSVTINFQRVPPPGNGQNSNFCFYLSYSDNCRIENLHLEGSFDAREFTADCQYDQHGKLIVGHKYNGLVLNRSKNGVVRNVEISNFAGNGLDLRDADDFLVEHCKIHHNYTECRSLADGIALCCGSENNTIIHNEVHHNNDDGIDVWQQAGYNFIAKNNIHHNEVSGIKLYGNKKRSKPLVSGPENIFYKNLAWENSCFGFRENGCYTPQYFIENVAYNNGSRGFNFPNVNGPSPYTFLNNLSYHNCNYSKSNQCKDLKTPNCKAYTRSQNNDERGNSWNLKSPLAADDFLSLHPDDPGFLQISKQSRAHKTKVKLSEKMRKRMPIK